MNKEDMTTHAKAAIGLAILNRLVPAPDHGAGFRRDPDTGFVYYSSEWLSDGRNSICPACHNEQWRYPHNCTDGPRESDAKATE